SVKMLRPYYIKADKKHVRVILAYQYFSIFVNEHVYHFIPIDAKEIVIHRKTKKIVNIESKFAFQKGKEIIYISMTKLISLPDFLVQIHALTKTYFIQGRIEHKTKPKNESVNIISELEQLNLERLIDKALDERDADAFHSLVKLL